MTVRQRVLRFFHEHPRYKAWALLAPGMGWLLLFFVVPLLMMFGYSFMPRNPLGGMDSGFTLDNYARFFDPLYLKIVLKTVGYALGCTTLCLLLGFPVAYAIARAGRLRNFLIFLVMLPFWTSFLVRMYAMMFLMRDSGLVNSTLIGAGLIETGFEMLSTPFAVLTGLVFGFLPFMVLPIYSSLEKLDLSLLEAASVLGARPAKSFFRVTLPLALPGVVAGSLLVFIPALGSFLTSDVLGGAKEVLVGNLVQNQFSSARDWPFGSAASFVMMTLVLGAVTVYLRVRDAGEAMEK